MVQGPNIISRELQGTLSPLILNADGESSMQVLRADQDLYPHSYTFCDLPEIPLEDKLEQKARLKMCNSGSFHQILASMVYDESR